MIDRRLKSRDVIKALFAKGDKTKAYPLLVLSLPSEKDPKYGVSVSKRSFKRAVHRNKIKRQLRAIARDRQTEITEAYKNSNLFILYIGQEMPTFRVLEKSFAKILKKYEANNTTDI